MNSEVELDNIVDIILESEKIGIFTHISPDGDAIGSSLALYLGLKELGKDVDVVIDDFSSCFEFLKGIDAVKKEGRDNYDLLIALDCPTKKRMYDINGSFDSSKIKIVIDHHVSNGYFGDYNYVEENSAATCQTLVKVLKKLNIVITKEMGECLISGIITDSGGFRYDCVNEETFEIAAEMLGLGVNVSDIYYKVFAMKTKAQFELATIATSRLKFYCDNKIVVTYLTKDDFIKTKAKTGDHEGIVDIVKNIEGVEVSIFLREERDSSLKISLRSNSYVNVNEIAQVFDGGGHTKAAGVVMNDDINESIEKLVKEASKRL